MSKARAAHAPPKRCQAQECEKLFQPYHRLQRFCSEKCRDLERAREFRATHGEGQGHRKPRFSTEALQDAMLRLTAWGKVGC